MTTERRVAVAVLGSGPCGLGAAYRLMSHYPERDFVIVDERPAAGGSASTVRTPEGFLFDYGGHVLFPHQHYDVFLTMIEALVPHWHASKPIRGVWIDGRLVPYPVQNNIHRLGTPRMAASLAGLVALAARKRAPAEEPDDLQTYLRGRFGYGLSRFVLEPLNRKMWAHEPAVLDASWTNRRSGSSLPNVVGVDVRDLVVRTFLRKDAPGWTDETRVRYPLDGGSGAIWSALAAALPAERFLHGSRVEHVDARAHVLRLRDGTTIRYDHLVTTIPLDAFAALAGETLAITPRLAPALRYSRAHFVGLGIAGEPPAWLRGVHSFHVPAANVPYWRVSFPGAFSPHTTPPGHWSILAEVSEPRETRSDRANVARRCEDALRREGIVPRAASIVSRWNAAMQHGYPTPFRGRDAVLEPMQNELAAHDIYSRGRFGGWKYEVSNQDHTFMQGVEVVDAIAAVRPETTYVFDRRETAIA